MLAFFILNGRLCDFFHLTLQRYNIFIAVHEYFTRNFLFFCMSIVTMVTVTMVKIENRLSNSATII